MVPKEENLKEHQSRAVKNRKKNIKHVFTVKSILNSHEDEGRRDRWWIMVWTNNL